MRRILLFLALTGCSAAWEPVCIASGMAVTADAPPDAPCVLTVSGSSTNVSITVGALTSSGCSTCSVDAPTSVPCTSTSATVFKCTRTCTSLTVTSTDTTLDALYDDHSGGVASLACEGTTTNISGTLSFAICAL